MSSTRLPDKPSTANAGSVLVIVASPEHTMPAWQKRLFLAIAHNSAHPVDYFGLPATKSISMGAEIGV